MDANAIPPVRAERRPAFWRQADCTHHRVTGRTDAFPARHRFVLHRVKVIRIAIEHAVSVAGVLLLTEATLTEVPDAKPDAREPVGVE